MQAQKYLSQHCFKQPKNWTQSRYIIIKGKINCIYVLDDFQSIKNVTVKIFTFENVHKISKNV